MAHYKLRRCSICKRYHAEYLVPEDGIQRHYCYDCWKAKFGAPKPDPADQLIHQIAAMFAQLPQVEAVALGGSSAGKQTDAISDIDLYVYTREEIPVSEREKIVEETGGASTANLGLNYWGPGDEWYNAKTGIEVDIVYFDPAWMEDQIDRVVRQFQASQGYTTCFWRTVAFSKILYDRSGWFRDMQIHSQTSYPEELRKNIVVLNHPLLRGIIPAYLHQIEKAVKRSDLVSMNHRLAALLASYFDILFAVNYTLHPGEKKLVQFALVNCEKLPKDFEADIQAVLRSAGNPANKLVGNLNRLLDHLDDLLIQEWLFPDS